MKVALVDWVNVGERKKIIVYVIDHDEGSKSFHYCIREGIGKFVKK
jgi:hypothetical protein